MGKESFISPKKKHWLFALGLAIIGPFVDSITTHYALAFVKGLYESNQRIAPFLWTPWILLIEALFILLQWAVPYTLSRWKPICGSSIVAPLLYGLVRFGAGLHNLVLILSV